MALTRRIARPLLASIFVAGGLDALRNPAGKVEKAEAVTEPLRQNSALGSLDTETLVRINGGVQIGAGLLLATGRFRRLASIVLIGSIVPTTYAGHRFWEETDEVTRAQQRTHFLKNVGLLGGLILAAVDTEGEPSLGWRAKRRVHQVEGALSFGQAQTQAKAGRAKKTVKRNAKAISSNTSDVSRRALREARAAGKRTRQHIHEVGLDSVPSLAESREGLHNLQDAVTGVVRESGGSTAHAVQQAAALVASAAHQLEPITESAVQSAANAAASAVSKFADRLPTN
jgi:uncharacterized membrane protein YphA (DoxX/SURF4 family)